MVDVVIVNRMKRFKRIWRELRWGWVWNGTSFNWIYGCCCLLCNFVKLL